MLNQLRIRYDPREDRLILGLVVESGDGDGGNASESTLALTRRVWMRWRQDLQAMLDLSAEVPEAADAPTRRALSAAHHQAQAAQQPVRAEPASASSDRSPGAAAAASAADLVTAVRSGRRKSDRRWVLTFAIQGKPDLSLVLSTRTLHALVGALIKREAVTGWGLAPLPVASVAAAAADEPIRPLSLH